MDLRRQIQNSSAVVSSIGHLIKPLIGPRRSVKCIQTDDGCRFTSDAILLLEQLDIQHPVGQYIVDVCRGFMAQYKTGGENLLYFICQWTRATTLLCDMGISSSKAIAILRQAVNDCISHVDSLKQNIEDVADMVDACKTAHTIGEVDIDTDDQVADSNEIQPTTGTDAMHGTNALGIEQQSGSTRTNSGEEKSDMKLSCNVTSVCREERYAEPDNINHTFSYAAAGSVSKDDNQALNENSKQCMPVPRICPYALQSSEVESNCSPGEKNVEVTNDCDRFQLEMTSTSEVTSTTDVDGDDDDVSWFFQDCSDNSKASVQTNIDEEFPFPGNIHEHRNSSSVVCDGSKNKNEYSNKDDECVASSKQPSDIHQILDSCDESKSDTMVETVECDRADIDNDYNTEDACSTEDEFDLGLMKDLQHLKSNIEEDLKLVESFKTKLSERKDLKRNDDCVESSSSDFEKHSENGSDSEFDACFEATQYVGERLKSLTDINDQFETVQFLFEAKDVEKPGNSNKCGVHTSDTTPDEFEYNDDCSPVEMHDLICNVKVGPGIQLAGTIHDSAINIELEQCKSEFLRLSAAMKTDNGCKSEELHTDIHSSGVGMDTEVKQFNATVNNGNSKGHETCEKISCKITGGNSLAESQQENYQNDVYDMNLGDASSDIHDVLETCFNKDKEKKPRANLENASIKDCLSKTGNNRDTSYVEDKQTEDSETLDNVQCINSLLAQLGKYPNSSQASVLSNSRHFKSFRNFAEEGGLNSSESVISTDCIDASQSDRKEATCNTGMESVPTHGAGDNSTTVSLVPGPGCVESMAVTCDNGTTSDSTNMHSDKISGGNKRNIVKCTTEYSAPATSEFSLNYDEMENKPDLKIDKGKLDFSKLSVSRHLNEMVADSNNESFDSEQMSELKDSANYGDGIKGLGNNDSSLGETIRQDLKTDDREIGAHVVAGLSYRESRGVSDIVQTIIERYAQKDGARYTLPEISCYGRCGRQTLSVVEGVIVTASPYNVAAVRPFLQKPCRALLVNADISSVYHHKGYKPIKSTTEFSAESFPGHMTKANQWLLEIANIMKKLSVEVIFARGIISPEVMDLFTSLNIVALETVPYQQLLVLSDGAEAEMVTYITLATEENVCSELRLTPWDSDWCDKHVTEHAQQEVVVTMTSRNPVTVVLSDLTPTLVDLKQQELQDCYCRVKSAYQSGFLVPGCGHTEMACAQFCRQNGDHLKTSPDDITDPDHLLPAVFEMLEATFLEYAQEMKLDSSHDSDSAERKIDCFFDDYTSKVGAWNMAMDTVCTILNSDWYIITGITDDQLKRTHVLTL